MKDSNRNSVCQQTGMNIPILKHWMKNPREIYSDENSNLVDLFVLMKCSWQEDAGHRRTLLREQHKVISYTHRAPANTHKKNAFLLGSFLNSIIIFINEYCIYYRKVCYKLSELNIISITAKKNSFEARVECIRMNHGEQSLCQRKSIPQRRGQPPRMHGSALWKYGQKGQSVLPFQWAEGAATSGARSSKGRTERPEQGSADTASWGQQSGTRPGPFETNT